MTTIALVNLIISLMLLVLLSGAYAYILNRKGGRKRLFRIAAVTFTVTIVLHIVIKGYIYTSPAFVPGLFFVLPFFVCVVVSGCFVLGKKAKDV